MAVETTTFPVGSEPPQLRHAWLCYTNSLRFGTVNPSITSRSWLPAATEPHLLNWPEQLVLEGGLADK